MIEICGSYEILAGSYSKRIDLALKHRVFLILKFLDFIVIFHGRQYDRVAVQIAQSRSWHDNDIISVDA
jgi:hypothetical protein